MSTLAPAADLALYVEDLGGGGVQVVFLRLATELAKRGHRIELWVAEATGALADRIPKEIPVVAIPASSRWEAVVAAARSGLRTAPTAFRTALLSRQRDASFQQLAGLAASLRERRPRALLAATPYRNLEALLARELAASPVRVFVSEHNDLRSGHALATAPHRAILERLQPPLYERADGIVAVSEGVAQDIARRTGLPRSRIAVIYNPAVTAELPLLASEPVSHPWLRSGEPPVVLTVGRLGASKDLPTLVRAFARLRARRDARLVVVGADRSPKRTAKRIAALQQLAARLGVGADVDFPGYTSNPFAWMQRAAVLAVSSRNEGFCNVIAEALACGCPVVSTDCPSGPAEILERGAYGRLVAVGDDAAFADALEATLAEPRDPDRLRARAACFSCDAAVSAYERLLWRASAA